ncbi:hypothetical protein [Novosphingobium sp. MMS21-SN21R]|uniref:hypothetical protein n=1 Tax=Novosphingobium sp. MMS21-SN21R TaxID=2969298 RepID=UPI002885FB06|nr:hypothetical protein [Novosphingobium sp. MMS21-SN21R]MDT0510159.1 hypothetical protein [Novosphingobium sp. MMS21-SN21R]
MIVTLPRIGDAGPYVAPRGIASSWAGIRGRHEQKNGASIAAGPVKVLGEDA